MDTTARLAFVTAVVVLSRGLSAVALSLQLILVWCSGLFLPNAVGQEEVKYKFENIPVPPGVQAPFTTAEWIDDRGGLFLASEAGIYEWHLPDGLGAAASPAFTAIFKAQLHSHVERVFDLKRSPNQEWLAVAGGRPGESGVLEVWRLRDKELLHRWEVEGDVIYQVDWTQSCRRLVAAGASGVCSVFDIEEATDVVQYRGHSSGVTTISVMRDERTVVSGAIDQTIHLWRMETGRGIRVLDNHTAPVRCLIQGPQASDAAKGTILSASEDRTVRLWQPHLGRLIRFSKLPSGVNAMEAIVNRPDNSPLTESSHIVVGCDDGSLHRIDVGTMKYEQLDAPNFGRIYRLLRYSPTPKVNPNSALIVIAAKEAFVMY